MRLGPGKHLKGLSLFNGLVKPEEVSRPFPFVNFAPTYSWLHQFDYFHEVRGSSFVVVQSHPYRVSIAYHHPRNDKNRSAGLCRWSESRRIF